MGSYWSGGLNGLHGHRRQCRNGVDATHPGPVTHCERLNDQTHIDGPTTGVARTAKACAYLLAKAAFFKGLLEQGMRSGETFEAMGVSKSFLLDPDHVDSARISR